MDRLKFYRGEWIATTGSHVLPFPVGTVGTIRWSCTKPVSLCVDGVPVRTATEGRVQFEVVDEVEVTLQGTSSTPYGVSVAMTEGVTDDPVSSEPLEESLRAGPPTILARLRQKVAAEARIREQRLHAEFEENPSLYELPDDHPDLFEEEEHEIRQRASKAQGGNKPQSPPPSSPPPEPAPEPDIDPETT